MAADTQNRASRRPQGRQIGYAVLATLEALAPPETRFVYSGPVISGTWIGTWHDEALDEASKQSLTAWRWQTFSVELTYRHDLPTQEQTLLERAHWESEEAQAREQNDDSRVRDCRAKVEQATRTLARLAVLPTGKVFPYEVVLGQLGNAYWLFLPGELYQAFQIELRKRFPNNPLFIATISNNWQPGYLPKASSYGYDIYQDVISPLAPGCLETLLEAIYRRMR